MNLTIYALDLSLASTGHCLLNDGQIVVLETIKTTDDMTLYQRIEKIVTRVMQVATEHTPNVVVIEEYAFTASTNTITKLAELAGVVKYHLLVGLGYHEGHDALIEAKKTLCIQTQSQMKKFCLANGATKKDSRYLLEVFDRIKRRFEDDNQADAYMHAWMAGIVVGVLRGNITISDLPLHQQEALIAGGARRQKGLSIAKAMKLPEEAKRKLAGF
ncbi:MAG: crossover junction endodeoxyribonuclease RuvC [Phycisphaerales bacterium]|nr:crossover junction endodeoxyribonuclease RuvC [Phycisphaerales bacterium]